MGLNLITINKEIEWRLVQFWLGKDFLSARVVAGTQLIFLGTKFVSVSNDWYISTTIFCFPSEILTPCAHYLILTVFDLKKNIRNKCSR